MCSRALFTPTTLYSQIQASNEPSLDLIHGSGKTMHERASYARGAGRPVHGPFSRDGPGGGDIDIASGEHGDTDATAKLTGG